MCVLSTSIFSSLFHFPECPCLSTSGVRFCAGIQRHSVQYNGVGVLYIGFHNLCLAFVDVES